MARVRIRRGVQLVGDANGDIEAVGGDATDYELVRVLEDGSLVVREDSGSVIVWEPGGVPTGLDTEWTEEVAEVQCEDCGRFADHVASRSGRWRCYGGYGGCGEEGDDGR